MMILKPFDERNRPMNFTKWISGILMTALVALLVVILYNKLAPKVSA